MRKESKIWLGVVLTILILNICSCKPLPPSRRAACIACGDNGRNEGWFAYQMATGDIIEQEGVGMNVIFRKSAYFYYRLGSLVQVEIPDGIQEIKATGITGPGGRMTANGKRLDWSAFPGHKLWSQIAISSSGISGAYSFDYCTYCPPQLEGAMAQMGCGIIDRYGSKTSALTDAENNAINNPTSNTPLCGAAVSSLTLLQQQGLCGGGFPKEMSSGFMAGNLTDPNHYLRYSAPFMFSFIFKVPEPEELIGVSIPVKIWTGAYPQGIYLNVNVIASSADKMTHVARTDYFLPVDSEIPVQPEVEVYGRWTAFTEPNIWNPEQYDIQKKEDWLSYVDPNLYADPNIVPDPNVFFNPADPNFFNFTSRLDTSVENFEDILIPERILLIKTIPINAENDYLYIDIDWSNPQIIMLIAEHWLTAKKLLDFSGDGIINFRDWMVWE